MEIEPKTPCIRSDIIQYREKIQDLKHLLVSEEITVPLLISLVEQFKRLDVSQQNVAQLDRHISKFTQNLSKNNTILNHSEILRRLCELEQKYSDLVENYTDNMCKLGAELVRFENFDDFKELWCESTG